jgi:hypothetical protein
MDAEVGAAEERGAEERAEGRTRAVIAPLIDLRVGGPATARAYAALAENPAIEVVFVLGTAHASPEAPFVLTRKAYDTPLGPVATDIDLVERLAKRLPFDPYAEEMVHRREHSIEFQSLFLRAIAQRRGETRSDSLRGRDSDRGEGRGDRKLADSRSVDSGPDRAEAVPSIRMVPILCGSLHEAVEAGRLPEEHSPALREALAALREIVETAGPAAAVVAGADLSHVGSRFGDPGDLSPAFRRAVEAADRRALGAAAAGDAEGFYRAIADGRDRYRCCGLTPIYALLRVARPRAGRLLAYEQMSDPTGTVSYASMSFS